MKNAKKLIVASVLSMMTASCYAGSIVAGSEQKSSVDIGFISPQLLSVTNDKLGIKLAGDQNVPADVFPMTVNIAAYQA
ncbi:hypothetical protein LEB60_13770 [Salmonella enterica]|nr:hypothetical protein [Salmonella enterica]MDJ8246556.1 hypothetical protein [Salmonella enterica]MDJ8683510.1 hypothetical protein [Salmonella enterica]